MSDNQEDQSERIRDSLPTIFQLSELAAHLYGTIRSSETENSKAIRESVKQAFAIWNECGSFLEETAGNFLHSKQKVGFPYSSPLKVENHFLPRVDDEFLKREWVKGSELFKVVVGLAKANDRAHWFKKFVAETLVFPKPEKMSRMGFDCIGFGDPYNDVTVKKLRDQMEMVKLRKVKGVDNPHHPSLGEIMESLRKYGTRSHIEIMKEFRQWRIVNASIGTTEEDLAQETMKIAKKGLEHEEALKNGTSLE